MAALPALGCIFRQLLHRAPDGLGIEYKREIDGLRAIAVGAVVLHHAGFAPAAGYVGVDIFFVISGYLITALLAREQSEHGKIDVAGFYARRVRRIFPVACVVILAVLLVASQMPAAVAGGITQSAMAAALFVANIHFEHASAGYFTGDSAQFPLLHLWSLSVEEQFYLVWPALLIVAYRARLRLAHVLVVVAVVSFGLCEWLMLSDPKAAFYQMPSRAWELAVGGLVACLRWQGAPRWLAPVGLAITVAACFLPMDHFPGVGALPAVVGTAALLVALRDGASNVLLASRPMVGIGIVSYSLYLWHWPLLAVDRLLRIGPAPIAVRVGLLLAALVLAVLSYRYVESPIRRLRKSSRGTVLAGVGSLVAVAGLAFASEQTAPVPATASFVSRCHPYVAGQAAQMQQASCLGPGPKVLIWGDSFAHAWTPMAQALADKLGVAAATLALDGCPAIVGADLDLRSPGETANCRDWNAAALAYIRTNGADTLVISTRWQLYIKPGNGAAEALTATVHAAAPHVRRILIIGPTPVLPDMPDKCLALHSDCVTPRAEFLADADPAWKALRDLDEPNLTIVDPADWLCDAASCAGIRDGVPLYADTIHVSQDAAARYSKDFAQGWN